MTSFQNLIRTVDYKADKHELIQNQASTSQEPTADKAELERVVNLIKENSLEADERMAAFETKFSELQNESESNVEKLRS